MDKPTTKNVVLVHGGFVDGAGLEGVYQILKKNGYNVSIVQNPTTSLADDVAYTKRVLAQQDAPAILVGHSYGGVVITEAGNDPKVAGLVYITAFAPDKGESVSTILNNAPPGTRTTNPTTSRRLPLPRQSQVSRLLCRRRGTREGCVHGRLPGSMGSCLSQQYYHRTGLEGQPSWYLVVAEDKMIPPPVKRTMAKRAGSTVVETKGSHAIYVSQPGTLASLIEKAAKSVRPMVYAPA